MNMHDFVTMLDKNLIYIAHKIKGDTLIIQVASSRTMVQCPYCKIYSTKVHSTYQKEFQDLPIMNKKVIILLNNRKMFCINPECNHKTFAERFDFLAVKARKTERLIDNILKVSANVSSVTAASLLSESTVTIGKSSICRLLKKNSSDK
jgi:transposase